MNSRAVALRAASRWVRRVGVPAVAVSAVLLPVTAHADIYWAEMNAGNSAIISRATLDGGQVFHGGVRAADRAVSGVTLSDDYVYWSDVAPGIYRAPIAGGPPTKLVGDGRASVPRGLAVDGAHLYWADRGVSKIVRANLDGTGVELSFIPAVNPDAVAVNGSHIFWSNVEGSIGRANLDGTGVTQTLVVGDMQPRGIVAYGAHLYWADFTHDRIVRANLDGTNVNWSFVGTGDGPIGLAVQDGKLYWTNYLGSSIGRSNLDGTGVDNAFITGAKQPHALAVGPDRVPPSLSIAPGPAGGITGASPTFAFTAETGATVVCSIDTGTPAFTPCSSATTHSPASPLADGAHTFRVRATDAAGNTTNQSMAFTVDLTPPDTLISWGPSGPTTSTVEFEFFEFGGAVSSECRLGNGVWSACMSPKSYENLPDGSYTFQVRAIDAMGNIDPTPSTRSFSVDTVPPDTTITAGPTGSIATSTAQVAFSGTGGPASYECRHDNLAWQACASPFTIQGLSDGSHTFWVRAKDPAGNVDPTPATTSFTVDTTPPDTEITSGPTGSIATSTALLEFGGTGGPSSYECSQAPDVWTACSSPHTAAGLPDGSVTFQVRAKDVAGNVDPSPASRTFTVDTTPPATTPPVPTPPHPTVGVAPSNVFTLGKIVRNKKQGTVTIRVTVPAAGKIAVLRSKKVVAVTRTTSGRTTVTLRVKAAGKAAKSLRKRGRVTIPVSIRFSPTGGTPRTRSTVVTLIRR